MKQSTLGVIILLSFLFTALTSPTYETNFKKSGASETITLNNISSHLNRNANKLTEVQKSEFPLAEKGFTWNSEDSKTKKWRTQGITGLTTEKKQELVIVSWYGRKDGADYRNRGSRVSIINVTNMDDIKYRHVLLVEENLYEGEKYLPFYDEGKKNHKGVLHAGGIVALDGKLHVADSRRDHKVIRVFNLNEVKKLPRNERIHKYEYILVEEYSYKAKIKPSFISYDSSRKKILMGTYNKSPSNDEPNEFTWFNPPVDRCSAFNFDKELNKIDIYRLPDAYKKIQGMVATQKSGKQILWLSTSYGSGNRSNFYKMNLGKMPTDYTFTTVTNSTTYKYPPGLEDAYLSSYNSLWMLTEFAYKENSYLPLTAIKGSKHSKNTRRVVFAINQEKILP